MPHDAREERSLLTIGLLTRGALHEISNPLVGLIGSAELALDDAEPGTKLHDRIALTQRTGAEIAGIVRALQAFIRLQELPARPLSLGEAAAEAVALVDLVMPTHNVTLTATGDATVVTTPGELSCSLVELLVDALERSDCTRRDRAHRPDRGKRRSRHGHGRRRAAAARRRGRGMSRILVVDDEPVVRELTVEILRRSGYNPHGVPSAKQALELLDEEPFDLVVSDVVMPEMTGVEFLYELRERLPDLPVLLMTGGSKEPERATKAVALGACSLLYKPFTHAELKAAVEAALKL